LNDHSSIIQAVLKVAASHKKTIVPSLLRVNLRSFGTLLTTELPKHQGGDLPSEQTLPYAVSVLTEKYLLLQGQDKFVTLSEQDCKKIEKVLKAHGISLNVEDIQNIALQEKGQSEEDHLNSLLNELQAVLGDTGYTSVKKDLVQALVSEEKPNLIQNIMKKSDSPVTSEVLGKAIEFYKKSSKEADKLGEGINFIGSALKKKSRTEVINALKENAEADRKLKETEIQKNEDVKNINKQNNIDVKQNMENKNNNIKNNNINVNNFINRQNQNQPVQKGYNMPTDILNKSERAYYVSPGVLNVPKIQSELNHLKSAQTSIQKYIQMNPQDQSAQNDLKQVNFKILQLNKLLQPVNQNQPVNDIHAEAEKLMNDMNTRLLPTIQITENGSNVENYCNKSNLSTLDDDIDLLDRALQHVNDNAKPNNVSENAWNEIYSRVKNAYGKLAELRANAKNAMPNNDWFNNQAQGDISSILNQQGTQGTDLFTMQQNLNKLLNARDQLLNQNEDPNLSFLLSGEFQNRLKKFDNDIEAIIKDWYALLSQQQNKNYSYGMSSSNYNNAGTLFGNTDSLNAFTAE